MLARWEVDMDAITLAELNDSVRVLTMRQIAEMLGVSFRTVQRMDKRSEIPGRISIGRRLVRFERSRVEQWLESRVELVSA